MIKLVLNQSESTNQTKVYEVLLDSTPIGMCQLRLTSRKSSTMPEGFESNIYYEVFPDFRGKGYANEILAKLIIEAKLYNLTDLILTVAKNNLPSKKVILHNGGIFLEEKLDNSGEMFEKYILPLH